MLVKRSCQALFGIVKFHLDFFVLLTYYSNEVINVETWIRDLRKAAGMTQEQLASKIGVTRATLSRYENGTIDPPMSQIERIVNALEEATPGITSISWSGESMYRIEWPHLTAKQKKILDEAIQENGAESDFYEALFLPTEEHKKIARTLDGLNEQGRKKLVEIALEFAKIPEYQRQPEETELETEPKEE